MKCQMQQFRQEYVRNTLSIESAASDPFHQFHLWFDDATQSGIIEPNAMALATSGPDEMPSVRIVLLKEYNSDGFVFFTNYHSRKGMHLATNPKAALLFYWNILERQVRIEGKIKMTEPEYSDNYFHSRPFESRVGAIVSMQSSLLKSRATLEASFNEALKDKAKMPERPDYWGGYIIQPQRFEFWQGREHRLHDRIQYRYIDGAWVKEMLAP